MIYFCIHYTIYNIDMSGSPNWLSNKLKEKVGAGPVGQTFGKHLHQHQHHHNNHHHLRATQISIVKPSMEHKQLALVPIFF